MVGKEIADITRDLELECMKYGETTAHTMTYEKEAAASLNEARRVFYYKLGQVVREFLEQQNWMYSEDEHAALIARWEEEMNL